MFPCEQFGPVRAGEIQALVSDVMGEDCRHGLHGDDGGCPVLALRQAEAD